jgi:3-phenylpropionate/trans-cinnamate dioxygenase ferredoxin reductase subunit
MATGYPSQAPHTTLNARGAAIHLRSLTSAPDMLRIKQMIVFYQPELVHRGCHDDLSDRVVIAGGGLAAVRTAQALRELQHRGRILMLSDEVRLPYDRPPLSKNYLQGKVDDAQIQLMTPQELEELRIEVRLSQRVVGLERTLQQVRLAGGEAVGYDRLVVATGARPVRLGQFEPFDNVHVLRSVNDAYRLRESLQSGRRVGIVGAGFIGLEIAAAAIQLGCRPTVLETAATPLSAIPGRELGECIQRWHERKGVSFRCGVELRAVRGAARVEALELADGEVLEVDVIVVGVGQTPNVEWLAQSGLDMYGGLVCDVHGRTQDPRVFGVGDAVCTKVDDHYHPTRQWTAVTEQARRTAGAICGKLDAEPIVEDFYFWSDQHGVRLQFAGRVPPNPRLVWVRGGPHEERFAVLVCRGTQVRAVFSLGSPREFLAHSGALRTGESVALEAS